MIGYYSIFIFIGHLIVGICNLAWYPDNLSPLIIMGGSSAIFFVFLAKSYEERCLSLINIFFNNLFVFYVLRVSDPYIFIVSQFIILISIYYLFLFVDSDLFLDLLFIAVLLSRIFYHPKIGEWGFGLVTELIFLRLYSIFFEFYLKKESRSGEGSRIEPLIYLIPLFGIAFLNLKYLDNGLKGILIHINFLFAGASLIYRNKNWTQNYIYIFCLILNGSIGYFLAESVMTFCLVSFVFLISNLIFASLYFLKARRSNKPLSYILLSNKREGIHILIFVYLLVLGALLTQLNPGSGSVAPYSNWLIGLGIQIGFLTALNYLFKN